MHIEVEWEGGTGDRLTGTVVGYVVKEPSPLAEVHAVIVRNSFFLTKSISELRTVQ